MKKIIFSLSFFTICISSFAQYDQNFAIGVKIGEPIGINIRKYMQYGDRAFDVNFGTYGFVYGRVRDYRKGAYEKSGMMLQGLYNFHTSLGKKDGLHAYYGFGAQFNFREYISDASGTGFRGLGEKHLSLGPAGNAGLEFDLPGNEVGVFLDAGAYAELFPDIFFLHPQINAGIRVNLVKRQ